MTDVGAGWRLLLVDDDELIVELLAARLKALLTEVEKAWPAPHWRPNLDRDGFLKELRKATEAPKK